jgi:2-oxoglutarate ferredoxin oxidoreductase subunit beta
MDEKIYKEIVSDENMVYKKTSLMTENVLSYCPGCGHGTAHRIIMEVIDEMGLQRYHRYRTRWLFSPGL